jgi:hypothetical protein
LVQQATRRFEALARTVALILVHLQEQDQQQQQQSHGTGTNSSSGQALSSSTIMTSIDKAQVWRTLKITSASLAARAVFAVTGGLAGPGAIAAAAGSACMSLTVSHTAATTATFLGIGGGSLVG